MKAKALLLVLCPLAAQGQGFAGLGADVPGFASPERGREFVFPQEHGSRDVFRIEWWYITANLTSEDGIPYGLQWTLCRNALAQAVLPRICSEWAMRPSRQLSSTS